MRTFGTTPWTLTRALSLVVLALLGQLVTNSTWAVALSAPNEAQEKSPLVPLTLTISGGSSLGSYEAGFLYYLVETSKENPWLQFPVITGASAGAINTLLTAVSKCQPPRRRFEDSIFWKTWIPLGIDQLSEERTASKHALFSKSAMNKTIEMVRKEIRGPSSNSCESVIGIAVARKKPLQVRLTDELWLPHYSETIAFKMTQSKTPSGKNTAFFNNIPGASENRHQLLLPFTGDFDHDFDLVVKTTSASASFPGVFDGEKISHCLTSKPNSSSKCTPESARQDEFIDGGLYDILPLRSAVSLSKTSQNPILLLDPTSYDFLGTHTNEDKETEPDLFATLSELGSSVVVNARRSLLARALEEDPRIKDRILHSTLKIPLNSYGMGSFLGFFEQDFRENDFIYGMYEAKRFILRNFSNRAIQFTDPKEAIHSSPSSNSWKKFQCISKILDGATELDRDCQYLQEKELNSLILLQVNLDRLYHFCKKSESELVFPLKHCVMAQEGKKSPRLIQKSNPIQTAPEYIKEPPEYTEDTSAADIHYFFQLLENYQFQFTDLGLTPRDASHGLQKVNQKLFRLSNRLAKKQDEPYRTILGTTTKPLLDLATVYTPVRSILYLNFGTSQEFGWSSLVQKRREVPTPFRYQFAVRTQGFLSLLNSPRQFSFTPLAGFEFEPFQRSRSVLQYRVGVQVGRQFGSDDGWGSRTCTGDGSVPHGWACSGWVIDPVFIVSFLDRIRFQVEALLYPFPQGEISPPFQLTFQFGYQFLFD